MEYFISMSYLKTIMSQALSISLSKELEDGFVEIDTGCGYFDCTYIYSSSSVIVFT